jgi:protein TonB
MSSLASPAPRQRVLVAVSLIVAIAIAGGVYWWLHGTHSASGTATTGGQTASSDKDDNGVGILLDLAKTAVTEKRLVAPAGSNAYEFYLSVLQLDPNNKVALDELHESFATASADVERAINDNELDDAQRELSLLREFDSTNYILSLLGGKLDAQRQIMIRQDEARAAVIQAQQSASGGSKW